MNWRPAPDPLHTLPCDIHWFDLRDPDLLAPQELSERERARAARLAGDALQRRYVASHVALRRLLSRRIGADPRQLQIAMDPGTKPRLMNASLTFSLSRSEDVAVVALSDRVEVGIDIEMANALFDSPDFRETILTVRERGNVDALPLHEQSAVVRQLWVRKEAIVKALGIGLSAHPSSIEVGEESSRAIAVPGATRWADLAPPHPRMSAAVAFA